jgi:hypothetical protein
VKIYDVIGRLVGLEARKLELFGREHNIRKGWLSMLLPLIVKTIKRDLLKFPPQLWGISFHIVIFTKRHLKGHT